jgi:hypothetical protein
VVNFLFIPRGDFSEHRASGSYKSQLGLVWLELPGDCHHSEHDVDDVTVPDNDDDTPWPTVHEEWLHSKTLVTLPSGWRWVGQPARNARA